MIMLKSPWKMVWVCSLLFAVGQAGPALAGRSVQDGPSRTIFLGPQSPPMSLDLTGSDGSAGADGENRSGYGDEDSTTTSCDHHEVGKAAKNITMSNGRDGEAGEAGGNGGNGGDLTLYYQRRSDLQLIFVNASPGRGGPGGRGGRGAKGCRCPQTDWKVEGKTYHCTNGKRGSRGSHGANGADGRIGQLRLIAGTTPIAGDTPQLRMNLEKLSTSTKPLTLSLNRWDQQRGAQGLLQANSRIDDEYYEFRDRLEKTATVQWRSKSAISDYGSQLASLTLKNNGKIGFEFEDQELWSVVEQVDTQKGTTVAIDAVVHQRDALKLTPGITDQRDRNFTLAVIDSGAKSDIVNTQFSVKIKSGSSNGRPGFLSNATTHYEGIVPATAVKRDYNRFLLNLGSLSVPEDTFKVGSDVEVEITIVRSLGSRSAQQTIDWSGTVY